MLGKLHYAKGHLLEITHAALERKENIVDNKERTQVIVTTIIPSSAINKD